MIRNSKRWRLVVVLALATAAPLAEAQTQKSGWAGGGGEAFFSPLNVDWWYNWRLDEEGAGSGDADFFPMFWGGVNQNGINSVLNRSAPVEYVLGFNEPERPDQANMSVATALTEWGELVNGLDGSGIKLVSPAPSDTGDGRAWLIDFMSGVNADPNLHVDAVAFHWYGANSPDNVSAAANNFLNSVSWYRNQFNLPVMITEFGIHDWGGNYTNAEIQEANRQFLDIVVPVLEQRSYVAAYSPYPWFPDLSLVTGSPDGRIATDAGEVYAGLYSDGETLDMAGQDQGDDIVYLRGGTLTNTSRGEPSVGNVYALSGASALNGALWSVTEELRVASGAVLNKEGPGVVTIAGAEIVLEGSIAVEEGELEFDDTGVTDGPGSIHVGANGTLRFVGPGRGASFSPDITLGGGRLDVRGTANLRGELIVDENSILEVDQIAFAQLGLRSGAQGGGLRKQGAGVLSVADSPDFDGALTVEQGTLDLWDGVSTLAAESIAIADGAALDAAASDATLVGDLLLEGGSTVLMDLSGAKLTVEGTAALNGATLSVSASSPVAAGGTFDLFDWFNVTGEFGDLLLPALAENAAWATDDLSTTGKLMAVIAGDFDGDGAVDAADYTVWRDRRGAEVTPWSTGDANGDGMVDGLDYSLWEANFGLTQAAATTTPEPSSFAAAMLATALASWRRRTRSRQTAFG